MRIAQPDEDPGTSAASSESAAEINSDDAAIGRFRDVVESIAAESSAAQGARAENVKAEAPPPPSNDEPLTVSAESAPMSPSYSSRKSIAATTSP